MKNKTVWITGASSGIGKALAIEYAKKDSNIIISSRSIDKLQEVKLLCKNPDKVSVLKLDLDNYTQIDTTVKTAVSLFNGIDVLVNNGWKIE